jgi:hypothetical protein
MQFFYQQELGSLFHIDLRNIPHSNFRDLDLTSQIRITSDRIGWGGFGDVYRGTWTSASPDGTASPLVRQVHLHLPEAD